MVQLEEMTGGKTWWLKLMIQIEINIIKVNETDVKETRYKAKSR